MQLDDLSLKDRERVNIQNRAVSAALSLRDEEQRQQKVQQTQWLEGESARYATEAAAHVQAAVTQHKTVQETQQRHHNELREMITIERNRLEKECITLREQLSASQMEVSLEKERGTARLTEEIDRSERHLQDALSESLRAQTQLKTELSEVALRMKAEDTRRTNELDTKMARYRESLLTSHAMELEGLRERHQSEIKRIQAELQYNTTFNNSSGVKSGVKSGNKFNMVGRDSGSHWGAMGNSLKAQEEMESARPPPPVPFTVDEAYQSSLDGRSSGGGGGQGVSENAKRVKGYMSQLEEYLTHETQGDSDGDQDSLDGHIKLTNPKHTTKHRANTALGLGIDHRRNSDSDSSGSGSSDDLPVHSDALTSMVEQSR
eukprot:gene29948-37086_t